MNDLGENVETYQLCNAKYPTISLRENEIGRHDNE